MNFAKVSRYRLWGFVSLLVTCTVWSYVGTWFSTPDTPPKAYQDAFANIQSQIRPQDLVLIHPPWREDVVSLLSKNSTTTFDIRTTLPPAQWTLGQIILLKDRNGPPLSRRLLHMNRTAHSKATTEIDIQLLNAKPFQEDLDFMTLLPTAQVEVRSDKGKVTKCKWQNKTRRHICPGQPKWIYVGPHEMNSGKASKTCIWSHPAKNGTISISFPNPPLQSELEFEHALSSNAVRSGNKSPVAAELFLDRKSIKKISRTNQVGFQSIKILTPKKIAKQLEVQIKTKKDGARHYCFNLRSQKPEGGQ